MLSTLPHHLALSSSLFLLILLGYLVVRIGRWSPDVTKGLSKFVFNIAVPALLFKSMSRISNLPSVDMRLLLAFFGSCLCVFVVARLLSWKLFRMDGAGQSVFGLGCIYGNNVFLGVPLAQMALGEAAMPTVALIIAFNGPLLWLLVTMSVEFSRQGRLSPATLLQAMKSVISNPVIASIILGVLFGFSGVQMPDFLDTSLQMTAKAAAPTALVVIGMGLAEYGIREGWHQSIVITGLKLLVQPLLVWGLALAIGLPKTEMQTVVMMASLPVGVNAYLMAEYFGTTKGPVASSMVLSTMMAAFVTPIFVALSS